jgi:formate dehydrogenase subunit delta
VSGPVKKLVTMVNQIAAAFAVQPGDAAQATVEHLRAFWAPAMRQQIIAHARAGGEGLSEVAAEAVSRLAVS